MDASKRAYFKTTDRISGLIKDLHSTNSTAPHKQRFSAVDSMLDDRKFKSNMNLKS